MTILLLILAILPSLVICLWIYDQDKYEKESVITLAISFIWGVVSTIPAIFAQSYIKGWENPDDIVNIGLFSFAVVGLTEELSKFFFLRFYAYPKEEFNEPMDGIVYAVMVGMGFATLENVFYVMNDDFGGIGVAIGRAITAIPAHAAFAVLMGAYIGLAKFYPEKRNTYMLTGVVLAIFFHGLYDFFLLQKAYESLAIVSIIVLVIVINVARSLVRLQQEISPFNPDNLPPPPPIVENDNSEIEDNSENNEKQNLI